MDDNTNKLFEDFKTRDVLDGISADNFDSLKDEAFITESNKGYFEDLLRTGWLSGQLSSSGPMPNTSFNTEVSITASGEGNGKDVFNPKAGEVWSLQGMSFEENISGNAVVYAGLKDSAGLIVYFSIDTTGGSPWSPDNEFNKMVYVDQNMTLFVYVFGTFSGSDKVDCSFNLIRVR
tara:strand:- start:2290 stop:2820 length:531 start_codon:yes stop_codon:yes gene_type:complete